MPETNGTASKKLTATEQRMFDVLKDGATHSHSELHACLNDELGDGHNVGFHMSNLRAKLRPKALSVLTGKSRGSTFYQLVRLLASPLEE